MIIWNDYNKYNFDYGIPDDTFGELLKEGKFTYPKYPFYADDDRINGSNLKANFQAKFEQHFKYNQIAFDSVEMFKDMFLDIMQLNYPKYLHYYNVLQKTADLKWWNNKDFIVKLERELDSTNASNFTSILDTMDKFTSDMRRTGTIGTRFERFLKASNDETNDGTNTTTLERKGKDTLVYEKKGDITTDFIRNLQSIELQKNEDNKRNDTFRTSNSSNKSDTNTADEKSSNSTTKNLDTPQGTINNLMDNVNAYMTTATIDSNRETDISTSTVQGSNQDKSEDVSITNGTDKKDIQTHEKGNTKNTEKFSTTDTTYDTKNTTDTTTEKLGAIKYNRLDETGHTTNLEDRNTRDNLSGNKEGQESSEKAGFEEGHDIERFTRTEEGNIGVTSAGQLVEDWLKKGYINLDKMIIRDCEELFLQVY